MVTSPVTDSPTTCIGSGTRTGTAATGSNHNATHEMGLRIPGTTLSRNIGSTATAITAAGTVGTAIPATIPIIALTTDIDIEFPISRIWLVRIGHQVSAFTAAGTSTTGSPKLELILITFIRLSSKLVRSTCI